MGSLKHAMRLMLAALLVLIAAADVLLPSSQRLAVAQGLPDAEGDEQRLLIWQAGGQPGRANGPGTLVWYTDGRATRKADVPDESTNTRVFACGPGATAPDGSLLVAYAGGEVGGLYALPLAAADWLRLGDAHALACSGPMHAAFSPDGARWAYIAYPPDATRRAPSATGRLRVLNMPGGEEAAAFEDTAAFHLEDAGVFVVQFLTNALGLADEAVLSFWDDTGTREWAALNPSSGCDWASAALDVQADPRRVILSLGERCPGGSQWQLVSFSMEGAPPETHVYMPSGGAYLPTSMVNQVYLLADGQHALAVYPNGRAADIGNLVLVDLTRSSVTLVTAGVVVDNALDGPAAHIAFSPDGRFAAYISATANDEHFIHRLALDGTYQPLTIPAGPRGDVIGMFAFSPEGSLVFTAGGIDGQDNSLFVLPADAVEARRVLRGRYMQNAGLALDGAAILLAYVPPDDSYPEPAANLVRVTFDETQTVLLEGRATGMVSYPLAIR